MPNIVNSASSTVTTTLGTVADTADWLSKGVQSLSNYTDYAVHHSAAVSRRAAARFAIDDKQEKIEGQTKAVLRVKDFTDDLREELQEQEDKDEFNRIATQMFGNDHNLMPAPRTSKS